jgi:hypothetical protein
MINKETSTEEARLAEKTLKFSNFNSTMYQIERQDKINYRRETLLLENEHENELI